MKCEYQLNHLIPIITYKKKQKKNSATNFQTLKSYQQQSNPVTTTMQ